MSNIITNPKSINFTTTAMAIFYPNGRIVSINKIKNYHMHIEYLDTIRKNQKEIKKLLENIDMNYYLKNPAEMLNDILPIFAKENYALYLNLTPNTVKPTNNALMFLPENINKSIKANLYNLHQPLSNIVFLDIARFNCRTQEFESYIETYQEEFNSHILYEIINENPTKRPLSL